LPFWAGWGEVAQSHEERELLWPSCFGNQCLSLRVFDIKRQTHVIIFILYWYTIYSIHIYNISICQGFTNFTFLTRIKLSVTIHFSEVSWYLSGFREGFTFFWCFGYFFQISSRTFSLHMKNLWSFGCWGGWLEIWMLVWLERITESTPLILLCLACLLKWCKMGPFDACPNRKLSAITIYSRKGLELWPHPRLPTAAFEGSLRRTDVLLYYKDKKPAWKLKGWKAWLLSRWSSRRLQVASSPWDYVEKLDWTHNLIRTQAYMGESLRKSGWPWDDYPPKSLAVPDTCAKTKVFLSPPAPVSQKVTVAPGLRVGGCFWDPADKWLAKKMQSNLITRVFSGRPSLGLALELGLQQS
jgi:hypothetical protein